MIAPRILRRLHNKRATNLDLKSDLGSVNPMTCQFRYRFGEAIGAGPYTSKVKRRDFCEEMQLKMKENDFVERLIFCDEATFHISGKVNVQNVRICGTEQPHAQMEHQRDFESQRFLCGVPRQSARPVFLH